MILSFGLIIRLLRCLSRTLGVVFLRSYASCRRVLSFCLRHGGPRVWRCQAKSRNEERPVERWACSSMSPASPPPVQILATAPTSGSTSDIALSTPVITTDAPPGTANFSHSAAKGPVRPRGSQQPDPHPQAGAQSQNTAPDRPLSPASLVATTRHSGRQRVLKPTTADLMMERRYSRKGKA
ncbi:hypothetical protein BS17DRAFT_362863 [Gyrodon lividus]|nr:hypothetical protein BS17DRAFT_362863 [Gyrodon lividus]